MLTLAPFSSVFAQHAGHSHEMEKKTLPEAAAAPAGDATGKVQKGAPIEAPPLVEIPPDKQRLIGVKTAPAAIRSLRKTIRTTGRVEFDEKKLTAVSLKIEGWIEKLYVDYTGRYVKKGEPLAEIYSPDLLATQQEYLNALKMARKTAPESQGDAVSRMLQKDAEVLLAAARQRLSLWDISDQQIKALEETGKPVRTMTLYSPATGYVTQKAVVQGMRVMPGEKLLELADLSSVWMIAEIYEFDLPFIREGQTVTIALQAVPGKTFQAGIEYLYPTLSSETRTAKIRFALANPGNRLKPQMYSDVEIRVDLGHRLVVPAEAVIDTGERQIVYVDHGEGNFEPREVKLGVRGESDVEVLGGLKQGEKVASSANFLIDSEAQLRGVTPLRSSEPAKAGPPPAHKH